MVISKLAYGLSTLWLVSSQRWRLDGFHARALRRILGIPAAFVRVSNKAVFEQAGVAPISEQVLHRQLVMLGKAARAPHGDPVRRDVFVNDSVLPCVGQFVRRVGRPRQEWTTEVLKAGSKVFGSSQRFDSFLRDRSQGAELKWRQELKSLFQQSFSNVH